MNDTQTVNLPYIGGPASHRDDPGPLGPAGWPRTAVNVLGTQYSVRVCDAAQEPRIADYDGFCDDSTKEIFLTPDLLRGDPLEGKKDLAAVTRKVLRHEITHAFLCESGLAENSDWAQNEELVDWIAIQGPKLAKAWKEAGAI